MRSPPAVRAHCLLIATNALLIPPKLFQSQIWSWSISDFALLYFLSLYFILLLSLLLFQYQICNWSIQNFALHNRDSSLKLFLVLVFFNINTYWYFLFKWCPEKKMTDIVWWQLLWEKYHLWEATSVLDEVYLCADLAFVPKCHRGCHRPYLS